MLHPFFSGVVGIVACAAASLLLLSAVARGETQGRTPAAGVDQLPAVEELPDPFLLPDGSRVRSKEQWARHRDELKELLLTYEYGHLPPGSKVKAEEPTSTHKDDATGATERKFLLDIGPEGQVKVPVVLTVPAGKGPFPVIIVGDMTWGRVKPAIVAEIAARGYMLAEFDRTAVAPDAKGAPGGVRPLYPDADWGTVAAWAWGFHRVTDYVLTRDDVDPKRVTITGHSRGGKAALIAGALDERVALTCPNGSGCGGAGCYRFQAPKSEDIAAILKSFPYWFQADFGQFIGHVDRLPFDQHTVKALVAPRALLSTEALDDLWANPEGTQQSYLAAKEVFRFLGVENKIGIHFRPGKHEQNEQDWAALLDFADQLYLGKGSPQPFDKLAFPDSPKKFSWSAPAN